MFPQFQLLFFFLAIFYSCEQDVPLVKGISESSAKNFYKAKNVIVVVIDGPRYSETYGDSTHQYIPRMANDLKGIAFTNFYNNGPTYTNAGYASIFTGNYQEIDNSGNQLPENPSLFQYFLKSKKPDVNAAWLITSKGKLKILSDCSAPEWSGKYNPSFNCGTDGSGNGNRNDSITFSIAIETLKKEHPALALIGFKEPDIAAHSGDWNGYLQGIKNTDEYVFQLWNFIQNDSLYRDKTALLVTNDHGRHLNNINDGFISHGDDCEGCRHINLFVMGPDFLQNKIVSTAFELPDISVTVAELLGFEMPTAKGKLIREIFR